MSFAEFIQKEFAIVCDISYREITPRELVCYDYSKVRTLEFISDGREFFKEINGNLYCFLGSYNDRDVKCRYLCQKRDHNGNRTCEYANRYAEEIIKNFR